MVGDTSLKMPEGTGIPFFVLFFILGGGGNLFGLLMLIALNVLYMIMIGCIFYNSSSTISGEFS